MIQNPVRTAIASELRKARKIMKRDLPQHEVKFRNHLAREWAKGRVLCWGIGNYTN